MPAYIVGYGLTNPDRDHPRACPKRKRGSTAIGACWSSPG
jgi:hypothetical protein